eukprot:Mycagemm_TRINITY_DN7888_c0_g1::TRINITY_DN7888_c0_g1_i1::g.2447::m.2447 type:complete len:215 gc:universal TRINITY_DN7888_c0_g1_i1:686-42(-)
MTNKQQVTPSHALRVEGCRSGARALLYKRRELSIGKKAQKRAQCSQETAATTATTVLLLCWLLLARTAVNLPHERVEDLVDVVTSTSRSLKEGAAKLLCQLLALFGGDDTLLHKIALVAYENHRDRVNVLNAKDLVAQAGNFVKGGVRDNRIDQNEALAVLHVKVTHRGELFSSCGIENLEHVNFVVDLNLLLIRVLNSGIILLHENTLHELHG